MNDTDSLREQRGHAWGWINDLMYRTKDRVLTPAERAEYERLEGEIRTLTTTLVERGVDLSPTKPVDMSQVWGQGTRDAAPGTVRVLKREERMADLLPHDAPGRDISWNAYIRGIVTGDWTGIPLEARAMGIGTGAGGGFAVPDFLSARVIDLARNKARVFEAGATTVPMTTTPMKLARVAGDPSAQWKVENAAITAADMTLEQITLTPHTLIAMVKTSVELMEDSTEIAGTVENALAQALALELDRAALRGSGTPPEPTGIRNQSGVTIQSQGTNGAALTNYDPISIAIQTVEAANGEPNAYILSPRTDGTLDRLKDSTGQPLRPPPSLDDLAEYVTSQIPNNLTQGTSSLASEIYVAQWDELLVGMRQNLIVEASREAGDASGGAFTSLQVWIRAYLRADVALAHPAHFVVITGVL